MARIDWAKGSKKADDEVVVCKTGLKAGMARMAWPKPLHERGRSLFGGVQEADGEDRLARKEWRKVLGRKKPQSTSEFNTQNIHCTFPSFIVTQCSNFS